MARGIWKGPELNDPEPDNVRSGAGEEGRARDQGDQEAKGKG